MYTDGHRSCDGDLEATETTPCHCSYQPIPTWWVRSFVAVAWQIQFLLIQLALLTSAAIKTKLHQETDQITCGKITCGKAVTFCSLVHCFQWKEAYGLATGRIPVKGGWSWLLACRQLHIIHTFHMFCSTILGPSICYERYWDDSYISSEHSCFLLYLQS